jgi:hypothetical protein
MVGVNRNTGAEWAKQAKVRKAEQQARSGVIASKTELAAELTRIALHCDDVAPRDKVNAVATLSKVMGYDAPTRTEQVIVNASVQQWIEAQRSLATPAVNALPSSTAGTPPNQTISSSLSQSPATVDPEKS